MKFHVILATGLPIPYLYAGEQFEAVQSGEPPSTTQKYPLGKGSSSSKPPVQGVGLTNSHKVLYRWRLPSSSVYVHKNGNDSIVIGAQAPSSSYHSPVLPFPVGPNAL